MRPRNVRTRLTLWYVTIFGGGILIYICGAALLQLWQLSSQLYNGEIQDVETAEGLLYFKPDGTLAMNEEYHNHPESLLLLDRMMEVISAGGKVLYRNNRLGNRDLVFAHRARRGLSLGQLLRRPLPLPAGKLQCRLFSGAQT